MARRANVVRIEEPHIFAGGRLEHRVAGSTQAAVDLVLKQPQASFELCLQGVKQGLGAIGGNVVDEDDLDPIVRLRGDRFDAFAQVRFDVVDGSRTPARVCS